MFETFTLIAGPCTLEEDDLNLEIGHALAEISSDLALPIVFKASYDKANRSSVQSFRGPGSKEGKKILSRIKKELKVPILSDVHSVAEIEYFKDVLDIIQIPAFLCRQTDIILAAAKTGKPVNIKKGQFLAPWDVRNVIDKVVSTGNNKILITERGSVFGYNNLVVDFKGLPLIRQFGYPVCFDATHSVQLPGGGDGCSMGQREYIPILARGAVAAGVDGLFFEVHPDPDQALCDAGNSLHLDRAADLLKTLLTIHRAAHGGS